MIVDSKNTQKGKRGYKEIVLNPHYNQYHKAFLKWLQRLGYSNTTIKSYKTKLSHFFKYLQEQHVSSVYKIKHQHISNYSEALHLQTITRGYIQSKINVIKAFSQYLEKTENYKLVFREFSVEKELKTERTILTQKEVQLLFSSLEDTATGLRNNALLHLCYSCGLRSSEAVKITCKDIDYHKQLIYVAPGKNYRSRYVPISATVTKDLQFYKQYARPVLNPNGKYFLVAPFTDKMTTETLARYLKKALKKSPITKNITAHGLRHSIATHLLVQGMDLELISQFLGHKALNATEIYVRMSNEYIRYEKSN